MPMKLEIKKLTVEHEVDSMTDMRKPISANQSAKTNAGLQETIDGLGNPNRLQCEYVVGKNPNTKYVSPGTIEAMRPPKSEMKNG